MFDEDDPFRPRNFERGPVAQDLDRRNFGGHKKTFDRNGSAFKHDPRDGTGLGSRVTRTDSTTSDTECRRIDETVGSRTYFASEFVYSTDGLHMIEVKQVETMQFISNTGRRVTVTLKQRT